MLAPFGIGHNSRWIGMSDDAMRERPRWTPPNDERPPPGSSLTDYKVDELRGQVKELKDELRGQVKELRDEVRSLAANFATKPELEALAKRVAEIQNQINWAVKIVLGLVLAAIVGAVLVKGGVTR